MDQIKKRFPFFKAHPNLVYLDSAATTHKPDSVIEEIKNFYANEYGTVHRAVYQAASHASERYNLVREKVASFLNAKEANEIVFTRGATDAINLVAASWGSVHLKPGDEIALSFLEHHSNLVPWQMIAEKTGATIRWIDATPEGHLLWKDAINSNTKIVAVAHVSNVTGIVHPIEEIASFAHCLNACLLVDGAQAVSHLQVDVQKLGCDFYAFSGHKCYGPTGIGILYGKKALLETMPPLVGGGDMIHQVSKSQTTYATPPIRFEAGTPMIASVIGLGAAILFLEEIGLDHIAAFERKLGLLLRQGLQEIEGIKVLGGDGAIATFVFEGMHPLDVATLLDQEGISIRSGNLCAQLALEHFGCKAALRASLGIYNSEDDVERFLSALKRVLWTMKSFSN